MGYGLLLVVVTAALWRGGIIDTLTTFDAQDTSDVLAGELLSKAIIGQSFTARLPGVCRVDVRLATYARQGLHGPIRFRLQRSAATDAPAVVDLQIDASRVIDNQFYGFEFDPVSNSTGESLTFFLEAPEAQAGQALTVWGTLRAEAYAGGQALLRNLPDTGLKDLTFRVYYCPSFAFSLQGWLSRLAADRPGIFNQPMTYLALVCANGVVLSWLGLLFLRAEAPFIDADATEAIDDHKMD